MQKITDLALAYAKAVVAAVTPLTTAFVIDASAELTTLATAAIAAAATAVVVALTPNRELTPVS